MPSSNCRLPEYLLAKLLAAGCLVYILCALAIGMVHVFHPYELEWMEGGMVDHVQQLTEGRSLYREPAPGFVAYSYTPLYLYLSACLSGWEGWAGFAGPRAISLFSTAGCLVALYFFARNRGSRLAGLAAAGLFAGLFKAGGAWFAVARSDMLFLMLTLLAIMLLSGREHMLKTCLAGLIMALAFFAKQTALPITGALALFTVIFFRGMNRVAMPVVFAALVYAGVAWLDQASAGWSSFYIFELGSYHHLVFFRAFSFWIKDLASPLFISLAACLFYAVHLYRSGQSREGWFYFFVLAGLVGSAFLIRTRAGSFANTVLPAYLGIALMAGPAFHMILEKCRQLPNPAVPTRMALLAGIAQLLALFYDPTALVPTATDRAAGDHLLRVVRSIPGEVLIPSHGAYARAAGKSSFAHQVAIDDINRCDRTEIKEPFFARIREALASEAVNAVILDEPWPYGGMEHFEYRGDMFDNDEDFWPVTGRPMRPKALYVRRGIEVDIPRMTRRE